MTLSSRRTSLSRLWLVVALGFQAIVVFFLVASFLGHKGIQHSVSVDGVIRDHVCTKFDVVIPWINMTEAGYFFPPRSGDSTVGQRPYRGIGRSRIPFSEVVFALRSLWYNGAFNHVQKVFVLYDDSRQNPPHFLKTQSVVVPFRFSDVLEKTKFKGKRLKIHEVLAHLHYFAPLSECFMIMHDDMMLVKPFDLTRHVVGTNWLGSPVFAYAGILTETLDAPEFVGERLLSRFLSLGPFSASKQSLYRFQDQHVPFMVLKKHLAKLEDALGDGLYICEKNGFVCEFKNFHFYKLLQLLVIRLKDGRESRSAIGVEFHATTCGFALQAIVAKEKKSLQWLNVQGDGLSDEYKICKSNRVIFDEWLYKRFPKPVLMWENPKWEVW